MRISILSVVLRCVALCCVAAARRLTLRTVHGNRAGYRCHNVGNVQRPRWGTRPGFPAVAARGKVAPHAVLREQSRQARQPALLLHLRGSLHRRCRVRLGCGCAVVSLLLRSSSSLLLQKTWGFFNWIWIPWSTSEREFIERTGLDGYVSSCGCRPPATKPQAQHATRPLTLACCWNEHAAVHA